MMKSWRVANLALGRRAGAPEESSGEAAGEGVALVAMETPEYWRQQYHRVGDCQEPA